MRHLPLFLLTAILFLIAFLSLAAPGSQRSPVNYLGFDANDYPGDDALPVLRKTFSFAGYWIGPPPEEKSSSWLGKRALLESQGFGFLVLWNGPASRNLKSVPVAQQKGKLDAQAAAEAARSEGFAAGTVLFLDIEEGGRLSPAYHAYVHGWIESLETERFRAGVYCSSMPVDEGRGVTVTTAKDLQDQLGGRKLVFWVFNDVCPPAPGCTFPQNPPAPARGEFARAAVWQYAQSPRNKDRTAQCAKTYSSNGNCYAPGDASHKWFLDVDVADSPNPSTPQK